MNVSDGFGQLNENLKLDPDEVNQAREVHNKISDILIDAGVAVRTRLQGSFARKTMLAPLKDIDKIIELHTDHEDTLRSPGGVGVAMELVRRPIEDCYPGTSFTYKRHALGIYLPDCSFDFDAVPAFNTTDTADGMIEIANRDDDSWDESNTYELIAAVSLRNGVCDGKFILQVRQLKQVFKTHDVNMPGIHVEAFAHQGITAAVPHPTAVTAGLDAAVSTLPADYMDLTDFDQISDKIALSDRLVARDILARVADDAHRALDLAEDGDEHAACTIWRNIFGDNFPMPGPADAKSGISNLFAGGSVLGGITTAVRPTRPANPTRSWRP